MPDISSEIIFQTARSGGKGGQHVNKVETMVEGYFSVADSLLLSEDEKVVITAKLLNKISKAGLLMVKSQVHKSQLANKKEVINKMQSLIDKALTTVKPRKATRPTAASKKERLAAKKHVGEIKESRRKIQP